MGSNYLAILGVTTVTTVMSCSPAKKEYASFELYPVRTGSLTEMYNRQIKKFPTEKQNVSLKHILT